MELGGTQRRPWQPGVHDDLLRGALGGEVRERQAAETDDRDAIGTHHRDVDQMRGAGFPRRSDEALGLLGVALGGAGKVDDRADARDRGIDAVARDQVTHHVLDAGLGVTGLPAHHANRAPGGAQARYDEATENAGAAGDEDRWWCHGELLT